MEFREGYRNSNEIFGLLTDNVPLKLADYNENTTS